MDTVELRLKRFNMNNAVGSKAKHRNGKNSIFIGPRGTGKSVLIIDWLYHIYRSGMPVGKVFSPTEALNQTYKPYVPATMIEHGWNAKTMDDCMKWSKDVVKRRNSGGDSRYVDVRSFIIFDDMIHTSDEWTKDKNVIEVMTNGRHYEINFVVATQDPLGGIPPKMRTNFNFTFILREKKPVNKEKLFKYWGAAIDNKKLFYKLLDTVTQDNNCLVIDNFSNGERIEDTMFVYRARFPSPKFRTCLSRLWDDNETNWENSVGARSSGPDANDVISRGESSKYNVQFKF